MQRIQPIWTFIFIAVIFVGFLIQQITDLWFYFAFFPAFAFQAPWMFLTSIFLHADFTHLVFNLFALFFFGTYLEQIIGWKAFVALFVASGVIGNLGYMVTAGDPYIPSIGASGAVYGLIGALAIMTPLMMIYVYGLVPVPMVLAAVMYGFIDFAGLFAPSGIAHGAHLAGMFAGVAVGFYYRLKRMGRGI